MRLKLHNSVPKNGLVVYCGDVITEEGKEKKLNIDFEPFKPINTSLYLCDNKFHVEALSELLKMMTGLDSLSWMVMEHCSGGIGNTREVLHRFTVDLPKKYGKRRSIRFVSRD